MANAGFERECVNTYKLFVENFHRCDYIVAPSGSCIHHVRKHFGILEQSDDVKHVRKNSYELCEFLVNVLGRDDFGAEFPFRVGLHQSCHGLRGLHLGKSSEILGDAFSIPKRVLNNVKGITLVPLERDDECCGFGGTFAVEEEAVSVKMGIDRIDDHLRHQTEVITATDMSCLMHLEGIIRKKKLAIQVKHIAEILNNSFQ
jgi:L-lactate dehydrogenase complex protein LldE